LNIDYCSQHWHKIRDVHPSQPKRWSVEIATARCDRNKFAGCDDDMKSKRRVTDTPNTTLNIIGP